MQDYDKSKVEYERLSSGTKYYVEKTDAHEETKISTPSFQQIFADIPVSGGVVSFCDFRNGVIYFSSLDTYVYAVDSRTGKMIWKFMTGGPVMSTPLIHNNRIYFGSHDGCFYCLGLDGKILWKKYTGDIIVAPPIGIGNKIFVGNGRGHFFCFTEEGKVEWSVMTGDAIVNVPSAVNGLIFVGSYDKNLYAFDMDGAIQWKFIAGERIYSPVIFENTRPLFTRQLRSWHKMPEAENPLLFSPSYDNNLYAFGIEGNVLWKFNCGTSLTPWIGGGNGIIHCGTISGYVYAIDITGVEKWKFRTNGMVYGCSAVKNGNVYFTSFDQKLYCLSETGEKIWDFLTGGPIGRPPSIVGDKIYFGSSDTFLYCLNIEKRNVEWTFRCGSGLPNSHINMTKVANILAEYDKKVFRAWVPETGVKNSEPAKFANYDGKLGLDNTFAYGGLSAYSSKTDYTNRGKKDAYRK
ncbi:MAG: PQQ-binding-like beta-propeller repeat protein [Candidatus Aenigmatarchaeota archaeon]